MKSYYLRKFALLAASLLILIPCVLLMAWEERLSNPPLLWFTLFVCSAVFTFALYKGEKYRCETMTVKLFISKCGGFCIMLCFVAYKLIACFV